MTEAPAVAIVGMSGRFPGARHLGEYWENLHSGVCSIATFDSEELRAAGVDPAELAHPAYVPAKGHLDGADRFEAEIFGFNRTEAAILDPQHRLLLETTWSALEDAGYDPRHVPHRTGVYVGGSPTDHMLAAAVDRRLAAELGPLQLRILTDREFLAPWVSYRLGLDGPSLSVQTACSTSLTAVHLAAQALLLGECDAAVAGGVSVDSVHPRGYLYRDGGIFSPDGRCRPFDEKAAGTVSGNGVGVLVLRRLADALADADPIHAVILGSAVTNDGATKVGFTAPGVDSQSRAIVEAWSAAGLDPGAAQYLEMHGTATELGDRVELAATAAAVGATRPGRPCGIGSVKSNIGHLDAAAGVASLIKVALMLGHRSMAPTANTSGPHPDLARMPGFERITRPTPWDRPDGGQRLAGVTGLGIGGTNVHMVLAEAPGTDRPVPPDRRELLPISARTADQLGRAAAELAAALRAPAPPVLADVAYTLRSGRATHAVRAYVVAGGTAEAADALEALAEGRQVTYDGQDDELRALGDSWVAGADVRWPTPASGARRAHLPTYPFAGESLGALSLTTAASGTPAPQAVAPPPADEPAARAVTEAAVTELLVTTLGLAGPDDLDKSYFTVGGDSLTAVHLIGRLGDDLGIRAPIELFLEPVSLRELVTRLTELGGGADDALLAALLDEAESSQ
ncbi:beta-ketoacyl synthase N-terminal-like domain-containing protein [Micromonospora sp. NPDC005298]|uniref:beta-ketoacyl synthase N-terminal-like domain-containing protein n=1 Tax=Micromonospora sp. NPDC005298 TaxID=3156873 RepID=UPI0033A8EDAA